MKARLVGDLRQVSVAFWRRKKALDHKLKRDCMSKYLALSRNGCGQVRDIEFQPESELHISQEVRPMSAGSENHSMSIDWTGTGK